MKASKTQWYKNLLSNEYWKTVCRNIKNSLWCDRLVIGYAMTTSIILTIAIHYYPIFSLSSYTVLAKLKLILSIVLSGFVLWGILYVFYMILHRDRHPIFSLASKIKGVLAPVDKSISNIIFFFLLCFSVFNFAYLKTFITDFHPFYS